MNAALWKRSILVLAVAICCGLVMQQPEGTNDVYADEHGEDTDEETDSDTDPRQPDICRRTARLQRESERVALEADRKLRAAVCLNLTDPEDRADCREEAAEELEEEEELIGKRFRARVDLCRLTGGGAYDPDIDPENFADEDGEPNAIDNPYLPLPVGATWTYMSMTDEGLETIVVTVLEETREILGIECVSVQDTVSLDGEFVEDTIDWYAQDDEGNVWYMGEISFSFEDGYVESIEGSWLSGVDGAKPGIVMLGPGALVPGTTYRQEWLLGEAEDAGTLIATDASVSFGSLSFTDCVKTRDFLPPEPDAVEFKYYAPGIGFVYETKEGSDEVLELVSYSGL